MTQVKSSLSEDQIEQIKRSGKSVYRFLQEAVEQKLHNDEVKNLANLFDKRLQKFEEIQTRKIVDMQNELQENLLEAVGVINSIVTGQLERDNELKEKFNLAFTKIINKLNQGE